MRKTLLNRNFKRNKIKIALMFNLICRLSKINDQIPCKN